MSEQAPPAATGTARDFGGMLNQRPVTKGKKMKRKCSSPWMDMK